MGKTKNERKIETLGWLFAITGYLLLIVKIIYDMIK